MPAAASYGSASQAKPRQTHQNFRRFAAFKAGPALLYALRARQLLFPGSSAVEQPAVNRLVAGSNPARGAIVSFVLCLIRTLFFHGFFRFLGNLAPDLTLDAPASTLSIAAAVRSTALV